MVKAGCQRIVMITGYDNSDSPTGLRQLGFNYELDKKLCKRYNYKVTKKVFNSQNDE